MKTQLLYIIPFIAVLAVSASDTVTGNILTFASNAPRAGDIVERQETEYFSPGSGGEEAVWDFRDVFAIDECSTNYLCESDSSCITALEQDIIKKYSADSLFLKYTGYESSLRHMTYERPVVMFAYPFAYGDSLCTAFRGSGVYCDVNGIQTIGSVSVNADGIGSIILQNDTISNVLRVHTIRSASVNMNLLGDTTLFDPDNLKHEIEERYSWYGKGYRYPLFETVSTTCYNNMKPVSCLQKAYCCLPESQRLITDSLNEDIAMRDSLAADKRMADSADVISYDVSVNGSNVSIRFSLFAPAIVTGLVSNHMGFIFRQTSASYPAGSDYTMNISCSGFRRGVYILYINVNGKIYSEKINIE